MERHTNSTTKICNRSPPSRWNGLPPIYPDAVSCENIASLPRNWLALVFLVTKILVLYTLIYSALDALMKKLTSSREGVGTEMNKHSH